MTSLKFGDVTICDLSSNVLIACLFSLFIENESISQTKSPVANIRKMLLMEDEVFLYKLRAYHIHVKVGEKVLLSPVAC